MAVTNKLRRKAGTVADIRPAMHSYLSDAVDPACIVANFDAGGSFRVVTENRMRERRYHPHLTRVEASTLAGNLRKRGYRASIEPMPLI